MAREAVDRQKRNADKHGRANVLLFNVVDLVLLFTVNLPKHELTNVGSSKLLPKYIGPFRVLRRKVNAYTIELPRRISTHPTFYVGRLRPYHHNEISSSGEYNRRVRESPRDSYSPEPASQYGSVEQLSGDEGQPLRRERLDASARSPIDITRTPIGLSIDKCGTLQPRVQRKTLLPLLFGAITQIV